ncbi:hypothetical protein I4U23_011634 [Adineta vaga]|nr:hypothetical protein I4U23_011634 [Adineta vaga]
MKNSFLLFIFLITITHAQYPCSCSCCIGQSCQLASIGYVYASTCTANSCRQVCANTYYQCSATTPYGQSVGQCLSATTLTPIAGPYNCRCDCCNTGSATCATILIGYTTAYSCAAGACSVACSSTYPLVCISNQNGQTQGTCQGLTTTATTTTTIGPWLGNPCSCYCCKTNSYCAPTTFVGNTSASLCSTYACTLACQNQYSSLCPSSTSVGQSLGQCSTLSSGSTRCACKCCGSITCLDYDIYTSGDCTTCSSVCSQYTKCVYTYQVTYTCGTNSTIRHQFSISCLIFLCIFLLASLFSNF